MAVSKPMKLRNPEDMEHLQSEVASFASSLGLASSLPGRSSAASPSGFDDTDFRKTGTMKPPKPTNPPNSKPSQPNGDPVGDGKPKFKGRPAKPNPLDQIDPFEVASKASGVALPLMRARELSENWSADAAGLEEKVLGNREGAHVTRQAKGLEELKALAESKKSVAERLVVQYTADYDRWRRKSGEWHLVRTTARSGTTLDKIMALTSLVEDNPIANMKSLDILLGLVNSKVGKRYAFKGFEHLTALFKTRLLLDRKLKCLLQRPLDILPESRDGFSLLLFWYWEECLKQRYERFVIALEEASKDTLPNLKEISMKVINELLRSKNEQERRLLYALVNKLGDPLRKTASTAGYHLSCLLSEHPNMKAVVIEEVDSFIFRPHVGLRAKYHAVNFLSQILLSKRGDGPKVAKQLVDLYFALFKVLISVGHDDEKNDKKYKKYDNKDLRKNFKDKKKRTPSLKNKGEHSSETGVGMDSRLLCALLTGVNRAFPFVASEEADDIIETQTPILFRLVHSNNFNVGVQALTLLYQISSKNQIVSDRFYRALYSKLLIPAAMNSSKQEMFLGLLAKSMKGDLNLKRVAAFSKRLLQVSLQQPPQYACGCLFLLSEVIKSKPPLWTMMLQNESMDEDLEHFKDIEEGPDDAADTSPSTNLVGSIYRANISNDTKIEGLSSVSQDVEAILGGHDSTDVKQFETVSGGGGEHTQERNSRLSLPVGYSPHHREPSYCNADHTSWWELGILASHVHPSVAAMSRTLLSGANIVYNGNPFNDLSLVAFLDKFMEKKPKLNQRAEGIWHGGSKIAPARKLDLENHLIGEEILQLAEEEVPPEDIVFHKFYMNKTSSSSKRKKKKKASVEEDEATEELLLPDGGDESEDEVEDMLGLGELPFEEIEGDYDYDDLDKVVNEDDNDLLGDGSDAEMDSADGPSLLDQDGDEGSGSDDGIWDGEGDDGDDDRDDDDETNRKKKRRSKESPFVSIEDFERETKLSGSKRRRKPKERKKEISH